MKKALKVLILVLFVASVLTLLAFNLKSVFFSTNTHNSASSKIQLKQNKNKKKASNKKVDDPRWTEITWKELVQLNIETGEMTGNLPELVNKEVKIPGYIVPLTDDFEYLDEFLFVPNDQACIHVPPPPSNLIIRTKLKNTLSFEEVHNPSWLMGTLEKIVTKSEYGNSSYRILDAEIEKYEFEDDE